MATPKKKGKRKVRRSVPVGVATIQATFNNHDHHITDPDGNTLAWASAGAKGFKGSRKRHPVRGHRAAEEVAKRRWTAA